MSRPRATEPTVPTPSDAEGRRAPSRRGTSRAVAILLFLVCFLGTSQFFARFDRLRDLDRLGKMMRYLRDEEEQFDLLFFGSSRFMRGVDPKLFDRLIAQHGVQVRSFNMSHQAAQAYEIGGLIRRTYAETSLRPRWVVIELWEPDPTLRRKNLWKPRAVYWHTPFMTWAAVRDSLEWAPFAWGGRASLAWLHARHLLQGQLGTGRGALLAPRLLPGPDPVEIGHYLAKNRGYLPYIDKSPDPEGHRRGFRKQFEHFQAALPGLVARNGEHLETRAAFRRNVRAQVEFLRSRGAQPIYLLMPSDTTSTAAQRSLAAEGVVPTLLAYDDPDRYPRFYEMDLRWDAWHLSAEGARRFTGLLAGDVARYVSSKAEAKPEGTR